MLGISKIYGVTCRNVIFYSPDLLDTEPTQSEQWWSSWHRADTVGAVMIFLTQSRHSRSS